MLLDGDEMGMLGEVVVGDGGSTWRWERLQVGRKRPEAGGGGNFEDVPFIQDRRSAQGETGYR